MFKLGKKHLVSAFEIECDSQHIVILQLCKSYKMTF